MFGMLAAAFFVGLIVALPPGPVVISTGQRAIAGGFWHAFSFNLGTILADTFYALLVYFGLAALLAESDLFRLGLWLLGGAWLCKMGLDALRTRLDAAALAGAPQPSAGWRSFRAGVLITLLNPLTIVGWIALAGNFFTRWQANWPPLAAAGWLAIAAMLAGALSWVVLVGLVFSRARQVISPRLLAGLSIGSGLFLIVYGLSAWWSALDLLF